MIAETYTSIIFKALRNWTINSIEKKIEATMEDNCIFRGHMVVLGAPKSNGRAKIFKNFGVSKIALFWSKFN